MMWSPGTGRARPFVMAVSAGMRLNSHDDTPTGYSTSTHTGATCGHEADCSGAGPALWTQGDSASPRVARILIYLWSIVPRSRALRELSAEGVVRCAGRRRDATWEKTRVQSS